MPSPLADAIRQKYPGSYDGISDEDLENSVVEKYPEYKSYLSKPTDLKSESPLGLRSESPLAVPKVETTPTETEAARSEEPSLVSKLWRQQTTPLVDIRKGLGPAEEQFTQEHPYISTPLNFAADLLSSLSTPLNLETMGLGGAETLAARTGLEKIAGVAQLGRRALSVPVAAEGVQNLVSGHPITGGLELIGGIAGMRGPREIPTKGVTPEITSKIKPPISVRQQVLDETIEAERNKGVPDNPVAQQLEKERQTIYTPPIETKTAELTPIQKLTDALKAAKPLNKEQAAIYSEERGQRVAEAEAVTTPGLAGHYERLGKLVGEHTKVQMEPLKLDQTDVDSLVDTVEGSDLLRYQKTNATTGLTKILTGRVPQDSEIAQLEKVFGADVISEIRQHIPKIDTKRSMVAEIANLPRAVQASYDISFPFRQGLGLIHTKSWWTSWDDMLKSYGSEKAYRGVMQSILDKPNYKQVMNSAGKMQPSFAERSGLALTDLTDLTKREEAIMSTIAEKIPGIRASNRAYTAFANKLRSDNFDSLIEQAEKSGLNPRQDLTLARQIADYVNNASGRGKLPGALERSAVALNGAFFSPRLIASRLQMMNPRNYVFANPFVRKQYLKSMLATAGAWTTIAALGKMAGGEVNLDPDSADFGKVKIGNTRLDPAGGFQQYLVLAHRLALGEYSSSTTGKTTQYGQKFGSDTKTDALINFIGNKLAPVPAYFLSPQGGMLSATKYRPFELGDRTIRMFTPMIIQDISEIMQTDPNILPMAAGTAVGMGVQTYGERGAGQRLIPESIFPRSSDIRIPANAR